LIHSYIKSNNFAKFDLNQLGADHFNIITYDRAYCKFIKDKAGKDFMDFSLKIDNLSFYLKLSGKDHSSIMDVHEFTVEDGLTKMILRIFPQRKTMEFTKDTRGSKFESEEYHKLDKEIKELQDELQKIENKLSKEYQDLKSELDKKKSLRDILKYRINLLENASEPIYGNLETNNLGALLKDLSASLLTSQIKTDNNHVSKKTIGKLALFLNP